MSRILVIGSSHAAAIRRALPMISAEFPQHQVTCWTLTARCFNAATVDQDGILTPDPTRPNLRKQALRWNGAESVDLRRFDQVQISGMDLGMDNILRLLWTLQPLEWGPRPGARGVSLDFLRAAVRAAIDAALTAQSARIPFDHRFAATPEPCATEQSYDPALKHAAFAADVGRLLRAQELFALYEGELAAAHLAHGVDLVAQPRETIARAWVTKAEFIDTKVADCLHMNDVYGLLVFRALAARLPNTAEPARLSAAATRP